MARVVREGLRKERYFHQDLRLRKRQPGKLLGHDLDEPEAGKEAGKKGREANVDEGESAGRVKKTGNVLWRQWYSKNLRG